MPTDGEAPRGRRSLDKGRMESFSDGVFGFAATLLVVDLALGHGSSALRQVLSAWPAFVAYIISFLTIGAAWLAHTGLTDRLARVDAVFLRLNLLLLLPVVFLPFPTRLVAGALHNTSGEQVFVTMYGLTLLVIRVLGWALDTYARREHLYSPQGNVYVVIGTCFALLGAGFAVDGFQRYRRFIHILNMPSTPHQRSEMGRLTAAGAVIAVLGVATALMIVINRFA